MTQILREIRGGTKAAVNYSGTAGGNVSVWSGPGVLNTVMVNNWILSGTGVAFFDVNPQNVVSGLVGFEGSSSYIRIGSLPSHYQNGIYNSGSFTAPSIMDWQRPLEVGMPFFSGLAYSTASGTSAFTISFTPGKPQD